MSNLVKKIVAITTTITCAVWMMGPGVAQALTIAELQAQITALQAQLTALQGSTTTTTTSSACSGITFSRNLKLGMSGTDVKCMQAILNQSADTKVSESGAGSPGSETTYFGAKTYAAAVKFQVKYAAEVLTPLGLTAGTGFVGAATRSKLNTLTGTVSGTTTTGGDTTTTTSSDNKVSLAVDSPAAASIAKGAQNAIFAKINFCTAATANTVSKIVFTRTGIADDADISNVKIYDGITQVGSTQSVNSTTHKASFSSLTWSIPANTCKVLTLKASIAAGATTGDTPKLAIQSASDITSTVTLDGVFPIQSSALTISGIGVGDLLVATTTPSGSVVAGATEQGVAGFIFTASSTEGVKIHSVKITEVGTSVDTDISNIKLFYQSTQLGATVASLTSGAATFDLTAAPLEILAGQSKTLTVYADIGSSTGVNDRTVRFEITDNTAVTAYGTNSGGSIISYGGAYASDEWPAKGYSITVVLGDFTVAKDNTYSPSSKEYARGTDQNDMIAFKFTSGANEGVRVSEFKLYKATTTIADTSVSNITLYDAVTGARLTDTAGNVIPAGSMVSGYVDFGSHTTGLDSVGLFDVTKSSYKIILVKADIPSGAATATNVLGFKINTPTTQVWADGLSSHNDLGATEINAGITTSVPSTALVHTILEKGTLNVAVSSATPAAANYAVGTTNFTFAKFDLTSTGEDMLVTQFNVYFSTTSAATTTEADSADINNLKLYDGDTLLDADSQISSGYAEFAINLTVPKNGTKTLSVVGDIPTGSDAKALVAWVQKKGDLAVTGSNSNVIVYASASNWAATRGNQMVKGTPILTVKTATTPAAKTIIKNSVGALVTTLYLTATATEDIKVTRIQIAGDSTSTATTSAGTATSTWQGAGISGLGSYDVHDYVSNVKLYDGAIQVGSTVPTLTDGTNYDYANFTGLSLTIPKGSTKVIDVKLDVISSTGTVASFYFGVATTTEASVDIAASGVQSGLSATYAIETGGVSGQPMQFGDAGTLAIAADVDTPISAMVVESSTGNTAGKWKFTASTEAMKIHRLAFDVTNSSAATGTVTTANTVILHMATTAAGVSTKNYAFNYSINGAATQTCYIRWSVLGSIGQATTTDMFIKAMNSASSTCWASTSQGIMVERATTTGGALVFYASSSEKVASTTVGENASLVITDYPNTQGIVQGNTGVASNVVDSLKLGPRYGGSETIGLMAGADGNLAKVSLYKGSTWVADSYVGAAIANQVVFDLDTTPVEVPIGNTFFSIKTNLSDYLAAAEGSTYKFSIGTSSGYTDIDYVTAKGVSSGDQLAAASITLDGQKEGNAMYVYATKPTVSLNSASPSGMQSVGTNKEVFRFDVANTDTTFDLTVNAIRFTISTNASSAAFDKLFTLYKSTDLSTGIGTAYSWASATSTGTSGYVTIYPNSGNVIGSGNTTTYVLKANTASMEASSYFTISIEDQDFYWNDSLVGRANQKVLNLPVTGNLLDYK